MTTLDLRTSDPELDALAEIALGAAEQVMRLHRGSFGVSLKGPGDPVTDADRAANDFICAELARRFRGAAVVAEESVPADPAELARLVRSPEVFYVDPLDGTREFVDGREDFAVMIGLARHGQAALGVVALPAGGLLLAGRVGGAAYAREADGRTHALTVSPLRTLRGARTLVSRTRPPPWLAGLVQEVGLAEPTPLGSVGAKVGRLVGGLGDLYLHHGAGTKLWDCCAPAAILAAAGGRFTDLEGSPIDYASPDLVLRRGILASNGLLHAEAMAAVARLEHGPDPVPALGRGNGAKGSR